MRLPRVWLAANFGVVAVALAVSLVGGMFASCSTGPKKTEERLTKTEGDRKAAPSFSLKDADGRAVALADYKGKVVLLNFWATWCGPCKIEIPWFVDFEKTYKDRGFAVVGVSMDEEGWETVKPYLNKEKVNYRVLLGNDSVATMYGGVESLPTTFLIDQDGKIAATHVGLVSKSVYENEIKALLSGSSKTAHQRSDFVRIARSSISVAN